ncbi:MAG: Rne/Rng family ribonuclease [Gemmataceae bacterium]|nr:Rne/Rng family ribonuclease [Gemmataceae bacterium]
MKKEMLINVLQPEECRIAIVEDGVLEELYVERTSQESYVGNIYKGRIVNIEPSIQAAFVDFGIGRNGFLHVSDVEPAYYRHLEQRRGDNGPRRGHRGRERGQAPSRRYAEEPPRRPLEPEPAVAEPSPEAESLAETVLESEPVPASAPPESEPGTAASKPSRGTRRSRRRSGGREAEAAPPAGMEETPPTPVGAGPAGQPETAAEPAASESEPEPPAPSPRPRVMDSAERRTEQEDAATAPLESASSYREEDLFFPRSEPAPPKTVANVAEPAPAVAPPLRFHEESEPAGEPAEPELEPDDRAEELAEERFEEFDEEIDELPRRRPPRDERRGRRGRRPMGRPGAGRPKPLIQDIFRRGQEVLVQVIKEGIGTKGPTLSTYISIAGRYLVLMPGLNRVGVSRKIADDEQRRRLREIFNELQPPRGLGFIIRTAGLDKTKKELQRDLAYLSRLWQVVVRRIRKLKAPAEIYQESDMITRTIRDTFTNDIDTIWVDEATAFEHAQEFLQIVMPRYASRIKLYSDPEPLFHKYGIEEEIARIQQRHVPLPNGGSIVIDQTEALVAIDVNSGNFRADNNAEETAFQMNLLAAKEVARQLRLRDLGGVIVNDFIDMREEKHRRDVERTLRDAVRRDRARTKILKMSAFGIIEMTRQRIRPSLKRSVYQDCPHCGSTGQVKTCESMSIDVMRMIQLAAHRENIQRIQVHVHEDVANYLLNKKRKEISRLEETGEIQVAITGSVGLAPETLNFTCYDNNNNEVRVLAYEETRPRRR